jgi:hypothetical protein
LGDVDLIYVPEPSALVLVVMGLLAVVKICAGSARSTCREILSAIDASG